MPNTFIPRKKFQNGILVPFMRADYTKLADAFSQRASVCLKEGNPRVAASHERVAAYYAAQAESMLPHEVASNIPIEELIEPERIAMVG